MEQMVISNSQILLSSSTFIFPTYIFSLVGYLYVYTPILICLHSKWILTVGKKFQKLGKISIQMPTSATIDTFLSISFFISRVHSIVCQNLDALNPLEKDNNNPCPCFEQVYMRTSNKNFPYQEKIMSNAQPNKIKKWYLTLLAKKEQLTLKIFLNGKWLGTFRADTSIVLQLTRLVLKSFRIQLLPKDKDI